MFNGPKKIKYKKIKKGRLSKFEFKANNLKFGSVGLKALESGLITAKQIEASRQAIVRKMKKKGKLWIKVFPDLPITSKPTGIRMGRGKGEVSHWTARIRSGTILLEACGVNSNIVLTALETGRSKLPIKTKIIT